MEVLTMLALLAIPVAIVYVGRGRPRYIKALQLYLHQVGGAKHGAVSQEWLMPGDTLQISDGSNRVVVELTFLANGTSLGLHFITDEATPEQRAKYADKAPSA